MGGRRLTSFLLLVGALGLSASVLILVLDPGALSFDRRASVILPLVAVLVLGELFPIAVTRDGAETDEVSISSTVGLALVLVAPIGVVLAAQAAGLLIDELRRASRGDASRGHLLVRLQFNIGQYALAFIASRAVFASVAGLPFLDSRVSFEPRMLPAAWLAGLAFYVVNTGLTSGAFALSEHTSLPGQLRHDASWQVISSGMLLGLAPVYAQAVLWSPWLLPFLLFPLAVVHRGAAIAARRGSEALHDALTGLPNREMLRQHTTRRLTLSSGTATAMLLIDLDHFKDVNDTLGHHVGDDLICAVGDRIGGIIGEDDLLARLGGDEFAVVVGSLDPAVAEVEARSLAGRLCQAVIEPIAVDGITLHVGCSVGVSLAPEHGDTVDVLLQRADVALYSAKENRGGCAVYDPAGDSHSVQRLVLAEDLRRALLDSELDVAFQPQVHARTRTVVAVEALVRWTHPVIGSVDPERVVSLASSTGMLSLLTEQVLSRGLTALQIWDDAGHPMRLSVNLTARQLADTDLPIRIDAALERHSLPAHRLILEVTESTLMSDAARSMGVVQQLKDLGIELSIDDFGTGWSSLAHLQRLAPHELKIDRSFVIPMSTSDADRTIVRSTLELGHNLGLRVVAEGVEDESTAALLASWGCDVLQGYAFSVPRNAVSMSRWLDTWRDGVQSDEIRLPSR